MVAPGKDGLWEQEPTCQKMLSHPQSPAQHCLLSHSPVVALASVLATTLLCLLFLNPSLLSFPSPTLKHPYLQFCFTELPIFTPMLAETVVHPSQVSCHRGWALSSSLLGWEDALESASLSDTNVPIFQQSLLATVHSRKFMWANLNPKLGVQDKLGLGVSAGLTMFWGVTSENIKFLFFLKSCSLHWIIEKTNLSFQAVDSLMQG